MGDTPDVYISPESPGRPVIHNPFESPNDYHRLHECIVASPSVFRSSQCSSATPAKFKWSIDDMASLLPVEIDPEDIHRQTLYHSHTRHDSEIERKRQQAIEQFFTKGAIVPSPWAAPGSKQTALMQKQISSPCEDVISDKPLEEKVNAMCQTVLSLPVDFNLDKILGDYYRAEEVSDQIQESLSSSSLRRKLFLDGNGSGSESSTPSSPERENCDRALSLVKTSPLQCGIAALTPTSGQFSSSPIQGRSRACSLGSVASPMFGEKPSSGFKSPMLSPIVLQYMQTPLSGERKKLNFVTPDGMSVCSSNTKMNQGVSPYVEGCSPIKSCSPVERRGPGYRTSPLLGSPTVALTFEDKENVCPISTSRDTEVHGEPEEAPPHTDNTVNMELPETRNEDCAWVHSERESSPLRLTSSRTASMWNVESSQICMSLVAESTTIPYDCSMQVDSGYNTCSVGTNSTMEAGGTDSQTKECLDPQVHDEAFLHIKSQHVKSKVLYR